MFNCSPPTAYCLLLTAYSTKEVEHPRGQEQGQGRQGVGLDNRDGRDVKAGGGEVIAADGGGLPGPQPLLLDAALDKLLRRGLRKGRSSGCLRIVHGRVSITILNYCR